jgi:hypothetical protein
MNRPAAAFLVRVAVCATCIAASAIVSAHERKSAGALTLVIGWATEPAFSGSLNGVAVSLSDHAGPIAKAEGDLSVEVSFGNERITLPLDRVANRPNEFHAALVPTRAGSYTFHITGTINNQAIDISSTCSDSTFHCVTDAAAIQFPVKDPSAGQLAERLERTLPRADEAGATANRARLFAIVALVMSIFSVCAAALAWRVSRHRA